MQPCSQSVWKTARNRAWRSPSRRPGWRQGGFTLIEMLVVLGLVGILLVISVPEIRKTILRAKLDGALRDVSMVFRLARTEAIKRSFDSVVEVDPTAGRVDAFIDFPETDVNGNRTDNRWFLEPAGVFGQSDEPIGGSFRLPTGVYMDGPAALEVVEGWSARSIGPPPVGPVPVNNRVAVFTSTGGVRATGSLHLADNRGNYFEILVSPATTGKVQVRKWDCGNSEWVERRGEWPWYFGSSPAC